MISLSDVCEKVWVSLGTKSIQVSLGKDHILWGNPGDSPEYDPSFHPDHRQTPKTFLYTAALAGRFKERCQRLQLEI